VPINASGGLAIAPRPRGGDWLDMEVQRLRQEGVDILVSALTDDEQCELDLETEPQVCAAKGIEFVNLPIPDLGAPQDSSRFLTRVGQLAGSIRAGRQVAVHCRQSVGRSGLVAIAVMVALGNPLEAALNTVSVARGLSVPETEDQRNWLATHSDALSGLANG